MGIHDTTLTPTANAYTVGVTDFCDPLHQLTLLTPTRTGARRLVETLLDDGYKPAQIVVLDSNGYRLFVEGLFDD